jgi:hypothetical protein
MHDTTYDTPIVASLRCHIKLLINNDADLLKRKGKDADADAKPSSSKGEDEKTAKTGADRLAL